MAIELKPANLAAQPEGSEYLHLVQPLPTQAPGLHPYARQAGPINEDALSPKKEFTCGLQTLSGILLFCSFGMSTAGFVFYMFVITDSIWNDYFSTNLSHISILVGTVVYTISVLIRLFQGCLAGSGSNIAEKFAAAASIVCPGLKYHVCRKNEQYEGRISTNFSLDVTCNVLQVIAGILMEVAAGNSLKIRWWYSDGSPYYVHDALPLLCGIFLLVESVFLFSVEVLLHSKWITKARNYERSRDYQYQDMDRIRMNGVYIHQ